MRAIEAAKGESQAGRTVDPALVWYRQVSRLRTGLRKPRGLALGPDGLVYVVGDSELRALDLQGVPQRVIPLTRPPTCVAVEPTGALVVGYQTGVALHRPDGEPEREWSLPGEHPYVTCVTPAGQDLWVADAGSRVVLRYDHGGRLLGRIGERDDRRGIPGLLIPSPHLDVVVGPKGLLLVNNPGRLALETYAADGRLVSSWERPSMAIDGFCGCCNPTDIALLADGRVVTAEKGLPRVKVMNPDGTLSCVVAPPDGLSAGASGTDLAVGPDGRVYVLDPQVQLVRIFAESRP
jgi:sugar lactone lactonase YvrE